MKIINNNDNQEEYKAFLKNIREEKRETSNGFLVRIRNILKN